MCHISGTKRKTTVNPQKRPAGLILSLRVQMRVLLDFGPNLGIFAYCFLSFLRVLLECGSYLRVGLFRGFTVYDMKHRLSKILTVNPRKRPALE